MVNGSAIVGNDETSFNNIATVTGAGSSWTSTGNLYVGVIASSNSLVISDGGSVSNQLDAYIGLATNSSNNSVLLTGAGSTWSNTGILYVGYSGSSNSLVISNQGSVINSNAYIGYLDTSSNNSVTVTGTNSVWTNTGTLYVGYEGNHRLPIERKAEA